MSRLKYILSVVAVITATVMLVIAPDIAGSATSAKMNTAVVYESSASPVSKPLTATEVAQAYANGDFLYSYSHAKVNYDDLRDLSVKVVQELFAESQDLCKEITEIIRTAAIYDAGTTSALVMAQDRLATMEIVRVDFDKNLTVSFEKNTGLVLEFSYAPQGLSYDESRELQSNWECSVEAYVLSTIYDSKVEYEELSEIYESNVYLCIYIRPMWSYEGENTYEVMN